MEVIDLRSDTVTRPGTEMLNAMISAKVGDDVFGEDPTVTELENFAASLFGKESGLFCPSGTMTNQIAIKVHTQPGDEVVCDANSHIYNYEGGGISFNSGVQARLLPGDEGRITAEQIDASINGDFDWLTRTRLVSLENTINRAGGSYYELSQVIPIKELCSRNGLSLHLDGARIFNALAETGESTKEWGKMFDSISICLSKGLGAPAGSVLLGSSAFIRQARRIRKVFGGGMRQAGYIAAGGLYALQNNVARLKEDHLKAKKLAEVLRDLPCIESVLPVYTNIIIFNINHSVMTGAAFEQRLAENNIRVAAFGKQTLRFVTHLDLSNAMIERACEILKTFR